MHTALPHALPLLASSHFRLFVLSIFPGPSFQSPQRAEVDLLCLHCGPRLYRPVGILQALVHITVLLTMELSGRELAHIYKAQSSIPITTHVQMGVGRANK